MNSLRFEELNKKCKKLKRKKFLKFVLIPFLLVLIIFALYFLIYSKFDNNSSKKILTPKTKKISVIKQDKNSTTLKTTNKEIKPKPIKNSNKIVSKVVTEDKVKKDDKILLNPALNIPDINISNLVKKEVKASAVKKRAIKPIAKIVQKVQTKQKSFKINVKNVDKESVLIRNYKNLKNYKSALNLATFYFDKKNYKKCIYWAKIASQLGKTADKPWILYAKAKYSLNQKEDAIKSLQMYLNYFNSKDAYELLRKFKKERK